MLSCIWDNLKFHLGFWGAMAIIGVIMVGITALTVSTGGAGTAGLTALISSAVATTWGGAGATIAVIGGSGLIGTLVGGIAKCI